MEVQRAAPQDDDGTGIPEIDELRYGERIGMVGKFVVHKRPSVAHTQQRSTNTVDDIIGLLDELSVEDWRETRHTHSLMMIYEGGFKLSDAYDALAKK